MSVRPVAAEYDKKVLKVGVEVGKSPLSHSNEQGEPEGYLVDLIREVARERKLEITLDYRPWTELLEDFKAGNIDIISNMVFTPERAQYADFSTAHLTLPGSVFIRKDDKSIQTPADLKSKRMATAPLGYSEEYAKKRGFGSKYLACATTEECLKKLEAGEADFVLATKIFAENTISQLRMKNVGIAPFGLEDLHYRYHFAVLKGHEGLLYELDAGIIALRNQGIRDDLYEKWFGPLEPRKIRWSDLRPYWWPTAVLLILVGLVYWRQVRLLRKLRHQTEALKLGEERLTLVLEGSQDAFWDWDVVHNRVNRSERWSVMLGLSAEEISSKIESLEPTIFPDDVPRVRQARERLLSQGHGRIEYRVRARNGQWLWILDRGKVVARDSSGRPTRVTGAATDMTARKRIEEALGRSQALLEQSQRAADIGGWEYDVVNGVLYWTLQAFRIHDLDPDAGSPTLQQLYGFYRGAAQQAIQSAFENAIREAQSFDVELELTTANNRNISVRTIGRAEKDASRVIRIYGSFQDITFRKRAEDERQKIQTKMLEAQKLESLGVLAGGIAHDFNNLLTVIMGNASIAREDSSVVGESLNQIETAAQRAADLCRQMLAYAGRSRTTKEPTDLNNIVSDTVELLRLSISKNATLEFKLTQEILPVEVDVSQIRQVIMNLVINASDALGEGAGRIGVSTGRMQVTAETLREARLGQDLPPGDYISFEVTDDGCGMSDETLARIFDPFFTTKFTGRGLGLAAVLGIVRVHAGAFFVQSTLGQGSKFRMLLPPSSKPIASRPAAFSPPGGHLQLADTGMFLVVDDEPHVRKLAASVLERLGHRVALASDGYEALALALARGDKYVAILLDLTMPGLDGPSTLHELRRMDIAVPVLIMSGYSEYDVRQRFPKDPLLGFLPKPFTSQDLEQRLHELLSRTSTNSSKPVRPPTSSEI
ncbi:MAG: transporter substrate-binding domain-containing protein [Nibricoccus sp.]